jgi:hypothetical protein
VQQVRTAFPGKDRVACNCVKWLCNFGGCPHDGKKPKKLTLKEVARRLRPLSVRLRESRAKELLVAYQEFEAAADIRDIADDMLMIAEGLE